MNLVGVSRGGWRWLRATLRRMNAEVWHSCGVRFRKRRPRGRGGGQFVAQERSRQVESGVPLEVPVYTDPFGRERRSNFPEAQPGLAAEPSWRQTVNVPEVTVASDGLHNLRCARCGDMSSGHFYPEARKYFDQHQCGAERGK